MPVAEGPERSYLDHSDIRNIIIIIITYLTGLAVASCGQLNTTVIINAIIIIIIITYD